MFEVLIKCMFEVAHTFQVFKQAFELLQTENYMNLVTQDKDIGKYSQQPLASTVRL